MSQQAEVQPTTLYLAVAISDDSKITSQVQKTLRQRLARLQRSFQAIHPGVKMELQLFADYRLEADLLLVEAGTARKLAALGLSRQVRFPARRSATSSNPPCSSVWRSATGRWPACPGSS